MCINFIFWQNNRFLRVFSAPQGWLVRAIDLLDQRYNRDNLRTSDLRREGLSILIFVIFIALLTGTAIQHISGQFSYGWLLEAFILSCLYNSRQVMENSAGLQIALGRSCEEARATLALYSSQKTDDMDESTLISSAIQQIALAFRRGVMVQTLFYLAFGLPAALCVRALAIANHMVGHHTSYARKFGWAFTKVGRFIAHITGPFCALIVSVASLSSALDSLKWSFKAAKLHPHSEDGWSEGAFAGALGIKLSSFRWHEQRRLSLPIIGDGRDILEPGDLKNARQLYIQAHLAFMLILLLIFIGL